MSNEDKAIDAIIAQAFEEAGQCEEMENRATEVLGCSTPSLATAVSLLAEAKRAAVPEGRLARLIGKAIDDAVKAKPTTYFQQWEATARENSRLEAERDEARQALAQMDDNRKSALDTYTRCEYQLIECQQQLAAERARREAAEAVLERLPKTADGVPIVPGIRLFPRAEFELKNEDGGLVVGYAGVVIQDSVPSKYGNEELDVEEAEACFSTREAAQAALAPSPARPK